MALQGNWISLRRLGYFLDHKIRGVFATIADLNLIRALIPTQASASNQLADKAFVNSTIGTNTAIFRGTFNSVSELEAYAGEKTNNDYAFVIEYDEIEPTLVKAYNRYKYNGTSWVFEYALNNSSFTATQWEAINSGISSGDVATIAMIISLIPNQASVANQLADKAFVNSSVQNMAANFRGNWGTWNDVPTDANLYPQDYIGNRKPTNNDYMVLSEASGYIDVLSAIKLEQSTNRTCKVFINNVLEETLTFDGTRIERYYGDSPRIRFLQTGSDSYWVYIYAVTKCKYNGTIYEIGQEVVSFRIDKNSSHLIEKDNVVTYPGQWRFMYTGDWDVIGKQGWKPQYKIGTPFTAAQQSALDSGITPALVQKLINLPEPNE